MNQDFWDSIILITSSDTNKYGGDFGTGFVIHQDEQKTYVLTCAHVVDKVGGSDKVKVAGNSATVEAMGDTNGCDLAVLTVEDSLTKLPPLKLGAVGAKGREFITAGFHTDIIRIHQLAGIWGELGGMQIIASRKGDRTRAWNLEISDDSEHELKAGYSGSPVVDKTTGNVLGVIAQLTGQGKGLAISIEALGKVWTEIPQDLISKNQSSTAIKVDSMNPAKKRKKERLERELNLAEKQCNELYELIELTDNEINENMNDLARVRMLNKKKQRYEQDLQKYEQKVENLLIQIYELTQ